MSCTPAYRQDDQGSRARVSGRRDDLPLGDVSGAHLNPAVTGMFAIRRDCEWKRVPAYWAAQVAGATLAATTLRALFGTVRSVGTSEIHLTPLAGLRRRGDSHHSAHHCHSQHSPRTFDHRQRRSHPVGTTLIACAMIGGELTTASLNPARSLGPALVSGHFQNLWIFIAGPLTGAVIGLTLVTVIRTRSNDDEHTAAQ